MAVLQGIDVTKIDTDTPKFTLGSVFEDDDGKKYKYFLFNNGAGSVAAVAGSVGYYYGVSGAGAAANSKTVTMDITDSIGVGAGVFQAILTDGSWGWLQITGEATLTTGLVAGADGNALTAVGATDGTLDVSALVTDAVVAYAIDQSADIILCAFPE